MILDVGCGLKREGDVNLDINPEVKPDVVSDFRFLPLKNEAFNLVIFNHSLEHVPNPYLALNEAKRVLKKNGTLKVAFPNHFSVASLIEIIKGKPFWCVKNTGNYFDRHWSFFSSPQMVFTFISHGFKPMNFEADSRYFKRYRAMKVIYRIFPFLCPVVAIYGKKR